MRIPRPLVVVTVTLLSSLSAIADPPRPVRPVGPNRPDVRRRNPELERLAAWMTGSFTSAEQAKADPEYLDLRLTAVPIWRDRRDGPWLYVELAKTDARRQPVRQQVVQLVHEGGSLFECRLFEVPDPEALVGACRSPVPLADVTPAQLKPLDGCAVVLRRLADGTFSGGTLGSACGSPRGGAAYATSQVTVTGAGMSAWERGYDAEHKQVWGPAKGPYHFVKMDPAVLASEAAAEATAEAMAKAETEAALKAAAEAEAAAKAAADAAAAEAAAKAAAEAAAAAPPVTEPAAPGAPAAPPAADDPLAAAKAKSIDNLRTLGLYFVAAGLGLEKPWPKYSGKAFVLWLVASNKIDRRDPKQLEILFSPADDTRSLEKAGGVEAYAKLTLESLKTPDPTLGALTSYAVRRNAEREHFLTAEEQSRGAAILADLSFADGAVVAFVGGSAKWLTRAELGLGPDDPIVAGDASKSPILQHFSSE